MKIYESKNFSTASSAALGLGVGGLSGFFLAKQAIKKKEKELDRKLSDDEKLNILKKYVGIGALSGGAGGALIYKGAKISAQNGSEKALKLLDAIDSIPLSPGKLINKAGDLYETADRKKDHLIKKYIQGLSDHEINRMKEQSLEALAKGKEIMDKPLDELTPSDLVARQAYNDYILKKGMARQAMLATAGGLALHKVILPALAKMKENEKISKADEETIRSMVEIMQKDGRSEKEIKEAVDNYIKSRNFSLVKW